MWGKSEASIQVSLILEREAPVGEIRTQSKFPQSAEGFKPWIPVWTHVSLKVAYCELLMSSDVSTHRNRLNDLSGATYVSNCSSVGVRDSQTDSIRREKTQTRAVSQHSPKETNFQ